MLGNFPVFDYADCKEFIFDFIVEEDAQALVAEAVEGLHRFLQPPA